MELKKEREAGGANFAQLHFHGQSSATYTIEVSLNLAPWSAIGVAREIQPGLFEFTDTDAPKHASCYYRLRSP